MPVGTCLLLVDRLEKQVDGNPSGIWFLPHPEGIVSTCSTSVGYVDPVTWWLALHEVDPRPPCSMGGRLGALPLSRDWRARLLGLPLLDEAQDPLKALAP